MDTIYGTPSIIEAKASWIVSSTICQSTGNGSRVEWVDEALLLVDDEVPRVLPPEAAHLQHARVHQLIRVGTKTTF